MRRQVSPIVVTRSRAIQITPQMHPALTYTPSILKRDMLNLQAGINARAISYKVTGVQKAKYTFHGDSDTQLYSIWKGCKRRVKIGGSCPDYWANEINMSKDWSENYTSFKRDILRDIGPRPTEDHSLDRIDNDQDYKRGNVRWATPTQQMRNRRDNVKLTHNRQTKTLIEWAEINEINYHTAYGRYKQDLSFREIFLESNTRGTTGRRQARSVSHV